jgi:hypothetical protein
LYTTLQENWQKFGEFFAKTTASLKKIHIIGCLRKTSIFSPKIGKNRKKM